MQSIAVHFSIASSGYFPAYDTERPRVLSRIPDTEYVHVTGTDGERVYMALKEEGTIEHEVNQYFPLYNETQFV